MTGIKSYRRALFLAHISIALGLCAAPAVADGDNSQLESRTARLLAANCAACHGTEGRSQRPMPRLAGISKPYFVEQMNAFRSGARKETVMHQLARGYSEEQIGELADYFSSRN